MCIFQTSIRQCQSSTCNQKTFNPGGVLPRAHSLPLLMKVNESLIDIFNRKFKSRSLRLAKGCEISDRDDLHITSCLGDHGVVVRAFGLYWDGIRIEFLSTHHCWSLSKSFIPSLVVWSMAKNNAFGGEKQNKKSNGEQSHLCDLEQVTLKPQLQVHHCLTTWLQIWYHRGMRVPVICCRLCW